MTLTSYQDPEPHVSALVWLLGSGSGSALRLKAGSGPGYAMKPMRILNTTLCVGFMKYLVNQL